MNAYECRMNPFITAELNFDLSKKAFEKQNYYPNQKLYVFLTFEVKSVKGLLQNFSLKELLFKAQLLEKLPGLNFSAPQ